MKHYNKSLNYLQNAQERREKIQRKEQNIFQTESNFQLQREKVRLNYHRQEHKFSQDDIPISKQLVKREIKDILDPDVLELKKKNWNNSTSIPFNPESEETHQKKLQKIKLGLADGQNVKYKPPKIYTGTETRNIFGGWEQSSLVTYSRSNQYSMSSPSELAKSVNLASYNNQRLLPYEYRTPKQRQMDYTNFIREKKINENGIRQQLKDIYQYENPDCSVEKLNAGVHRLNYETKLKAGQLKQIKDDVNYTFSPDIERTVKRNLVKKYHHSGAWTKFTKEKENGTLKEKWAYSCCLNEDQNSQGCNQQIINKDKKILIGF